MKDGVMSKVLGVLTTTFTLLGINLTDIPYNSFSIIICVCMGVIIYEGIELYRGKKKSKIRKEMDSWVEEAIQSGDPDKLSECVARIAERCTVSNEKADDNKRNSDGQKKRTQCIIAACIVMIICCLFNYENVPAFARQFYAAMKTLMSAPEPTSHPVPITPVPLPSSSPVPTLTPAPAMTPAPTLAPPPVTEATPTPDVSDSETEWIKFRLEYPDEYPFDQKEYDELYAAAFYIAEGDLEAVMKSEITIWLNSYADNEPLDNAVTSSKNSTIYYVNLEESFSNDTLRSSNLLDELIDGREELMDSYPNEVLAWLLANHKQTYALNYLHQTKSEKSILYFYMGSIQDTKKSLEFEMNMETKLERIKYLQARYKDIADCEIIDGEYQLQALRIYVAIENALKELGHI